MSELLQYVQHYPIQAALTAHFWSGFGALVLALLAVFCPKRIFAQTHGRLSKFSSGQLRLLWGVHLLLIGIIHFLSFMLILNVTLVVGGNWKLFSGSAFSISAIAPLLTLVSCRRGWPIRSLAIVPIACIFMIGLALLQMT